MNDKEIVEALKDITLILKEIVKILKENNLIHIPKEQE